MAEDGRIDGGLVRGAAFEFFVDDERMPAFEGETIAAALLARGERVLRITAKRGEPRGYYCGMGVCWECALWVEGRGIVRGCKTAAEPGMRIKRLRGTQMA